MMKMRLFVVKQNRFNPTLQLLKRALTENRFGKIHMVNLNVFGVDLNHIMIRLLGEEHTNMMEVHL